MVLANTNRKGPQVDNNSSATAMLGLEGMAVLAVSEHDGEAEYAVETTVTTGWCPRVWNPGTPAWSAPDMGSRYAGRGSAGDAGLGQTRLALRSPRV